MTAPQPPQQPQGPTAQQLILDLLAQGQTQRSIAAQLGRSEDLVYMVKSGKRPGNNLVEALNDIAHGRAPQPIARRTNAAGETAAIRTTGGRTIRPPQPEPLQRSASTDRPPTRRTPLPSGPNRYRHDETILPGGREAHLIQFPRTNRTTRDQITDVVSEVIDRTASRGGRWQATLTYEVDNPDGTRSRIQVPLGEKGGYDARTIQRALDSGEGILDWINTQVGDRYLVHSHGGILVGIDMSVW